VPIGTPTLRSLRSLRPAAIAAAYRGRWPLKNAWPAASESSRRGKPRRRHSTAYATSSTATAERLSRFSREKQGSPTVCARQERHANRNAARLNAKKEAQASARAEIDRLTAELEQMGERVVEARERLPTVDPLQVRC